MTSNAGIGSRALGLGDRETSPRFSGSTRRGLEGAGLVTDRALSNADAAVSPFVPREGQSSRVRQQEKAIQRFLTPPLRMLGAGLTHCALASLMAVMIVVAGAGAFFMAPVAEAQTELAGVSGRVTDPSGAVIVDAEVEIKNVETNVSSTVKTNRDGLYVIPSLHPGQYLVNVRKPGFKSVTVRELTLNVQDNVVRNFALQLGSVSETVTINGSGLSINTTDAAVSTIVDRQFVENMPLNGRSFQSLLTLAPGVLQVPTNSGTSVGYSGEISVNGQRTEANYFTVDGVSVNTGTAPTNNIAGAGFSGGTPGETVLGTTQSLVSIDALQEFRATTSTYSAEYGRTPGGQFSFSTRSGTNDWHGSAFDYFRNEVLDANNWFNKSPLLGLPVGRLKERQNDFGGTLGGPVMVPGLYNGRDKTFLFFSYEGLRLTVPQPVNAYSVPSAALRQQAPAVLQPFLNVFPLPNAGDDGLNDGLGIFNLAYSAPSSLDNVSVRVDHSFGDKLRIFGRYADTTSDGWSYAYPAIKNTSSIDVRSLTIGATSAITSRQLNDFRFNLTQNKMSFAYTSTDLGGAKPLEIGDLVGPDGRPLQFLGSQLGFGLGFGGFPSWTLLANSNSQYQLNVTDTYTWSRGGHQFKIGIDWRRLTTSARPITFDEFANFNSEASLLANNGDFVGAASITSVPVEPVYHNFSTFVQDEWKASSRLSVSAGLRWDINPAPGNLRGPSPYTVDQIADLNTTKLAPTNTPLWATDWKGIAPRLGVAYAIRQDSGKETVLRAGFGIYYDLGNTLGSNGFTNAVGFSSSAYYSGVPFPLTASQATLPPPNNSPPYNATVYGFDPKLTLPYTMQWNLALEQRLSRTQTLTVNYVGSGGRKLLKGISYNPTSNPNFSLGNGLLVVSNGAISSYNALQIKYEKSLSHGLQGLASYTLSHSIDDRSTNFFSQVALLRASSDFDIRHNFQAAVTYDVPGNYANPLASAVLKHWGLDTRLNVRSAPPLDIIGSSDYNPILQGYQDFHADVVPGQPVYLYGSQYAGGRILNYNAFTPSTSGVDGNAGRNSERGFGTVQTDIALRREFPIHERLRLQFRAEAFNVFNHANFGTVVAYLPAGPEFFGHAYKTSNNSLGGLNSLYQTGGPRSLQLMLKLQF